MSVEAKCVDIKGFQTKTLERIWICTKQSATEMLSSHGISLAPPPLQSRLPRSRPGLLNFTSAKSLAGDLHTGFIGLRSFGCGELKVTGYSGSGKRIGQGLGCLNAGHMRRWFAHVHLLLRLIHSIECTPHLQIADGGNGIEDD